MKCRVEETKLIIEIDGKTYSFEANADAPCPSLLGWGLAAGGRYWSDRDHEKKLEKHIGVQDVALGKDMIAWYTQEFKPDGVDYKVTKNGKIYVGDLITGEQRLVYKGECYGDLCFDGNELYFNTGNKIAVLDLTSGEATILFKHSGIKKNGVNLDIREKRIFFTHWTHNNNYLMWYDREKKEVVNPHIDTRRFYFLNDSKVIYRGVEHTWLLDAETVKKKKLVSNKQVIEAITKVCNYLEFPVEEYRNNMWLRLRLENFDGERLYFTCEARYKSLTPNISYEENEAAARNLPEIIVAEVSGDTNGKDIRLEFTKDNVVINSCTSSFSGSSYLKLEAYSHKYR